MLLIAQIASEQSVSDPVDLVFGQWVGLSRFAG
jgi:hypothetical protein